MNNPANMRAAKKPKQQGATTAAHSKKANAKANGMTLETEAGEIRGEDGGPTKPGAADPCQVTNLPQATVESTNNNEDTGAGSDTVVSLEELGRQIVEFHEKAEANEKEASANAWESGTRLEQAYHRVYAEEGYGSWGEYLEKNCPKMSRTTFWRYRKVATCFTLKQVQEKTLSELYAAMKVATFEKEPLASDPPEPFKGGSGSNNKTPSPIAKVLEDVAKASKKFDEPASMSKIDKAAVKKLGTKMEDIHGLVNKPSILAISWQDILDKPVADWADEQRDLFEKEFARLSEIHTQVQAIKGGN